MTRHLFAGVVMIAAGLIVFGCRSGESQPTLHPSHLVGSAAGAAQPGHVWHMKKVEAKTGIGWDAMPQWGIEAKRQETVVAMSMMVPVDWKFGGGPRNDGPADCSFNLGRIGFFALSLDEKTGIVSIPVKDSVWSTDRQLLGAIQATNQQFQKMQQCKIEQPSPLAGKIAAMAQRNGKNIQIVSQMEPVPGMSEKLAPVVAKANASLAAQGSHIAVEVGRIRTKGPDKSGAVGEGWFNVMQVERTDRLQNGSVLITTDYPMQVAEFAPVGQLDGQAAMFAAMLDSVVVNPVYEQANTEESANLLKIQQITKQRLGQIAANMAADNANAARQQMAIQQGVQNYANQVHSNVAANRSAALEHSSQQFAMHMGDQALYHDPSTGQNVQLSNQYGHAWASTTGNTNEYILTDSPSYNPNGQVGSGSWSQMSEVR